MSGPLAGLRVVELAGIGPAPFAGMLLADLGADVVRADRPDGAASLPTPQPDLLGRGKRVIRADLKDPAGLAAVRTLSDRADVFIEGFRPGVAERLGLGPDALLLTNPKLVYGRMTGWGQDGPLANVAGHDLTYLALTGLLHAIGPADGPPLPPLNLVGDYGGGGAMLAFGVLAAVWQAGRTGRGQIVDAAVVDGAAIIGTLMYGLLHGGAWQDRRGVNLLDGGAPFYGVYETADGGWLAVGPLEPRFFAIFMAGLGIDAGNQYDVSEWRHVRAAIADRISMRSRDEWVAVFAGSDACVAPVLTIEEAAGNGHPHLAARKTFITVDGVRQPAPAPRFSRTPTATPAFATPAAAADIAAEWG